MRSDCLTDLPPAVRTSDEREPLLAEDPAPGGSGTTGALPAEMTFHALSVSVLLSTSIACGPAPVDPDAGPGAADDGAIDPDGGADREDSSSGDGGEPDAGPRDPLLVETSDGPVRGETRGPLRAFLGIPYAAPPVGDLRFRPPAPPAPWSEPLDATRFGPMCPQPNNDAAMPVVGDEDCLQLNVWTHGDAELRPVMVFIHGGGFSMGSAIDALYDGAALATAGDVVVVTINYRLGVLGLLATEELAAESGEDSAGNYGIRDQIAALEWVRDEIARFGGDPDNVTIFGESAGGVSVCVLSGSPLAEGLFHRAIVQSGGGCWGTPGLRSPGLLGSSSAIARGTEIVDASGCAGAADELACLRALPVSTLVEAGGAGEDSALGLPQFSPNIDGVVLAEQTFDRFVRGDRDVPLMIGSNADEATLFTIGTVIWTAAGYRARLHALLGVTLGDAVYDIYPPEDYASPKAAYDAALGEIGFVCPARAMADAAAGGSDPAFTYHFTQVPTGIFGALGATHGIELAYLFGNYPEAYTPTEGDLAVVAAMQRAWSSFARDGRPTGDPAWPEHRRDARAFYVFDEAPAVVGELVDGRCEAVADIGLSLRP